MGKIKEEVILKNLFGDKWIGMQNKVGKIDKKIQEERIWLVCLEVFKKVFQLKVSIELYLRIERIGRLEEKRVLGFLIRDYFVNSQVYCSFICIVDFMEVWSGDGYVCFYYWVVF